MGGVGSVFQGNEIKIFSVLVVGFAGVGLYRIWRKDWNSAEWVSERLVRIGVIAMQVGIFSAATAMGMMLVSGGDVLKIGGAFIHTMGLGFIVSILAMIMNFWLDLNIKLLSDEE